MHEGWRFNFNKHVHFSGRNAYGIYCLSSPDELEGCLLFEMKQKIEPFIAFLENAPHNTGINKRYSNVAGCLIAYACRLSFIYGKGPYLGWLAFEVLEENKEDERKLMAHYCQYYEAFQFENTTLLIPPEGGERLIRKYLK